MSDDFNTSDFDPMNFDPVSNSAELRKFKMDLKMRALRGDDLDVSYHPAQTYASNESSSIRDPISTALLGSTPDYLAMAQKKGGTETVDSKTYETDQEKSFAMAALTALDENKDRYLKIDNPLTGKTDNYELVEDPILRKELLNQQIEKAGKDLFNGDVKISRKTLASPEFRATQTVGSYSLLTAAAAAEEKARGDDGFFKAGGRAWDLTREQNHVYRDVFMGNVSPEEGKKRIEDLEDQYFRFSDGERWAATTLGSQFEYMAEPVTQGDAVRNAVLGAGAMIAGGAAAGAAIGAAGGTVAGGVGVAPGAMAGATAGAVRGLAKAGIAANAAYLTEMARLEYEENMGREILESYLRGDNLSREEIIEKYKGYALGSAVLDVAGTEALGYFGIAPIKKVLEPLASKVGGILPEKIAGKIFKNPQAAAQVARNADAAFKKSLKQFAWDTTKGLTGTIGGETATEAGQGAIEKAGDAAVQGKDISPWDIAKAGLESGEEAVKPSALLGTVFMTPVTLLRLGRIGLEAQQNLGLAQKKGIDEALRASADESIASGASREDVAANLNEVMSEAQNYYIDPNAAKDKLEKNGLSPEAFGNLFKNLDKHIADGSDIAVSRGVWNTITEPKARDFLFDLITDRQADQTKLYTDEQKAKVREELKTQLSEDARKADERYEQMGEIQRDMAGKFVSAGRLDAKQNAAMSKMYSAFFAAMSENTGISIKELYKRFSPTVKSFESVADANTGERVQKEIGKYNPIENIISLRDDADFSTLFHESAHFFVRTALELQKTNPSKRMGEVISGINSWLGVKDGEIQPDTYLRNDELGNKARKFDEALAYAIPKYLMGETLPKELRPLAREVLGFLSSLDNYSVYPDREEAKRAKRFKIQGNIFNAKFKQRFGEYLPEFDSRMGEFAKALFTSRFLIEKTEAEYPFQHDFADMKTKHGVEIDKADRDLLHELGNESREQSAQEIHRSMFDNVRMILGLDDKLIKRLKQIAGKDPKAFADFLAKHEKVKEKYDARVKRYKFMLDHSSVASLIDLVKEDGITIDEATKAGVDEATLQKLIDKGIVKDGASGGLSVYVEEFASPDVDREAGHWVFIGDDGKTAYPNSYMRRFGKEKGLLMWLANVPDTKTIAEAAACRQLTKIMNQTEKSQALVNDKKAQGWVLGYRIKYGRQLYRSVLRAMRLDPDKAELADGILKETARDTVSGVKLGELSAELYYRRAARAQKYATNFWLEGQIDKCAQQLRTEQYNLYCAKYAKEFTEKFNADTDRLRKFYKKGDKDLSKLRDIGGARLVQLYLERLGLMKAKHDPQREIDLLEEAGGFSDALYGEYIETAKGEVTNGKALGLYTERTVEELQVVLEKIKQLDAAARNAKKVILNDRAIEIEQIQQEVEGDAWEKTKTNIGKVRNRIDGGEKTGTTLSPKDTIWDKWIKHPIETYRECVTQMREMMQRIDGKPDGALTKYCFDPLEDARVGLNLEKRKLNQKWAEILNGLPRIKGTLQWSDVKAINSDGGMSTFVIGGGRNEAVLDIFGIALHLGNQSNYQKLVNGNFGVGTMRFEDREQNLRNLLMHLNKEHPNEMKKIYDACQKVWDLNDEVFKKAQRTQMLEQGFVTPAIPKRAFTYNGKRYGGGYVPLILNRDFASINASEAKVDLMEQYSDMIPSVKSGFLNARIEKAVRPISIDPKQLFAGTDGVLKYAYMQGAVKTVQRLTTDPVIGGRIDAYRRNAYSDIIKPILIATAQQCAYKSKQSKNLKSLEGFANRINHGMSAALMTFNVNNVLQQSTELPLLTIDVPPRFVIKYAALAAVDVLKSLVLRRPSVLQAEMKEKSALMRTRWGSDFDSANQVFRRFDIDPSQYIGWRKGLAYVQNIGEMLKQKGAYMMQAGFQHGLDTIAWHSSYEKYICEHGKDGMPQVELEGNAAKYADMITERYGTPMGIEETSKFDRASPFLKMFMLFTKYFTHLVNVRAAKWGENKRRIAEGDIRGYLNQMYCDGMIWLINPVMCEIINSFFRGYLWSDDDDDYVTMCRNMALAPLAQVTAAVPIAGKFAQAGYNKIVNDAWLGGGTNYLGDKDPLTAPALEGIGNGIAAGYSTAKKIITGDADSIKSGDIRKMFNFASLATGNGIWGAMGRPAAFMWNESTKPESERPEGLEKIPALLQGK